MLYLVRDYIYPKVLNYYLSNNLLHLKRLLFGIILLSSFGSAFADEYDPRQDVFDQIINVLVPMLIILLFDMRDNEEERPEEERSREELVIEREEHDICIKIRQIISPTILI
jgi:hypothetical protein